MKGGKTNTKATTKPVATKQNTTTSTNKYLKNKKNNNTVTTTTSTSVNSKSTGSSPMKEEFEKLMPEHGLIKESGFKLLGDALGIDIYQDVRLYKLY